MKTKYLIIGGGPIGLYLGGKLKNTIIIEQKKEIGEKTRCTGILTDEIKKYLTKEEIKQITINKINQTIIKGPTKEFKTKTHTNYIINNKKFEKLLEKKVIKNKNKILLNHKYLFSNKEGHHILNIKTNKEKIIQAKWLIGSDGPQSQVAKTNSLNKKTKNYLGYQLSIKTKKEHENKIIFYPHKGKYAWFVPLNKKIARIGMCTNIKNGKKEFEKFIKNYPGEIISNETGLIPTYQPFRKTKIKNKKHNIVLIGDSAGHIKNTTGGGIIPGLKIAEEFIKNPDKYMKKRKINKELYLHFLVHNILNTLNSSEWDELIKISKKYPSIFKKYSRDNLFKIIKEVITEKEFWKITIKKLFSGKVKLG